MAWSTDNDVHESLDHVKCEVRERPKSSVLDRSLARLNKEKSHYCLEQVRTASVENGSGDDKPLQSVNERTVNQLAAAIIVRSVLVPDAKLYYTYFVLPAAAAAPPPIARTPLRAWRRLCYKALQKKKKIISQQPQSHQFSRHSVLATDCNRVGKSRRRGKCCHDGI